MKEAQPFLCSLSQTLDMVEEPNVPVKAGVPEISHRRGR